MMKMMTKRDVTTGLFVDEDDASDEDEHGGRKASSTYIHADN